MQFQNWASQRHQLTKDNICFHVDPCQRVIFSVRLLLFVCPPLLAKIQMTKHLLNSRNWTSQVIKAHKLVRCEWCRQVSRRSFMPHSKKLDSEKLHLREEKKIAYKKWKQCKNCPLTYFCQWLSLANSSKCPQKQHASCLERKRHSLQRGNIQRCFTRKTE